jgi:hypothetical protein
MPLCIKHNVGVKEAAAADAKKRHCTDEACFRRSGCTQGWGDRIICQEDARPALTGHLSNRKARSTLKWFMGGMFRSILGAADTPQPGSDPEIQAIAEQKRESSHWNLADLAVLCTDGKCQVNMGTIPVLLIAPTCADTDGMECVVAAPVGLNKQGRKQFLRESTKKFQTLMVKRTASQN